MENNLIAERIKQLRTARRLSYKDLADLTGLSKSTLQRYETGSIRNIPLEKLDAIATALGTTVEEIFGSSVQKNAEIIKDEVFRIPVFDSVSAGFGCYADSSAVCYIPTFIPNSTEKDSYLWINVRGDSMSPTIEDGDRILVKRQDSVENGSIAVVMIGDDAFVKKIKFEKNCIELHSINPYYPVKKFEKEEANSVNIVGLVKEVSKKL